MVPLVGRIAAGMPITAEQQIDEVFPLPRQLVGKGELFMLKVVGDSMIDAAICDGDWVVVRQQSTAENGDIVAAMLDGEATVKVFQQRDGHTWLLPRNTSFAHVVLGRRRTFAYLHDGLDLFAERLVRHAHDRGVDHGGMVEDARARPRRSTRSRRRGSSCPWRGRRCREAVLIDVPRRRCGTSRR